MAHEILTLKLRELEDQFSHLSRRIYSSQTAGHEQLQQDMAALSQEWNQASADLRQSLQQSRAQIASVLANAYAEVEQAIQRADNTLQGHGHMPEDSDASSEEKILIAEYSLDFALLAANRALLLSLQAIDAQLTQEERRPL